MDEVLVSLSTLLDSTGLMHSKFVKLTFILEITIKTQ
jgi:hypothetical protein